MLPLPDNCLGCGVCCQHFSIIPVQPDDAVPGVLLRHDDETGQLGMIRRNGACIAFHPVARACMIYDIRPAACREVARGDCICLEALRLAKPLT